MSKEIIMIFVTEEGKTFYTVPGHELPSRLAWCKHCEGRLAEVVGVVVEEDGEEYFAIRCPVCGASYIESKQRYARKYLGFKNEKFGIECPPIYGHIPEGVCNKSEVEREVPPAKVIGRVVNDSNERQRGIRGLFQKILGRSNARLEQM